MADIITLSIYITTEFLLMGQCKYCGKEKELIGAHVLPKHFYYNFKNEKYSAIGKQIEDKIHCQNGFKDYGILCSKCDNEILGEYDKEAYRLLRNIETNKEKSVYLGASVYHYTQNEFDYKKIRKFFIALLWKASISKSEYMKTVDLGKYEDIALKLLKDEYNNDNLFKVVLLKENSITDMSGFHMFSKIKLRGTIGYSVYFADYIAYIFVKCNLVLNPELKIFNKLFITKENLIIPVSDITTKLKNKKFLKIKKIIKS